MKLDGSRLRLAASDLANHLGCRHLTNLNRLVATGSLKPPSWRDPSGEVMQKRGLEHDRQYLEHLLLTPLSIANRPGDVELVALMSPRK